MGEIKSVKVDNWGVFFLQKLQNFFNKTDFCDLTLQFKDNSQLKVHRLVLSACTDFFNVLEQTCELMEDALVMPAELQADVVVPIVNFMYTGTLEFELKMYNKLLKTAKEMNMTVLLKLLEAHKRTMETSRNISNPKNKRMAPNIIPKTVTQLNSSTNQPQRRVPMATNIGTPTRRPVMKPIQARNMKPATNTLLRATPQLQLQRGPTRFEEPNTETYEPSFDSISYESKPLKEEPEDYFELETSPRNRSSPFEQLRKGFNNNKRPAVATFTSPPAKKPNIEDVKEFSEQQRMRKQIAAEFVDDAEFDGVLDDEFHHDDDDEELTNVHPTPSSSTMVVKQEHHQQNQASIVIKQSPNEKPTIVVKDSSNSKMDHAKIITEVLRQYPHLVKGNKNIKLKIMPNIGGQSQKIIVKKETLGNMSAEMEQNAEAGKLKASKQLMSQKQIHMKKSSKSYSAASTSIKADSKPIELVPTELKKNNEISAAPVAVPPKRRIDSKTMHALIAQGAENTTGPWLCLRCGVNGRPISIPSYRGFRRHLINTHKESIDPALCEYCGWRSSSNRTLHHHMLIEHKVASLLYTFPECSECNQVCISEHDLQLHGEQYHPDSHKQQCIYCNKVFIKEMELYNHMKTLHKKRAREDGVIDFSDEEISDIDGSENQSTNQAQGESKIKILSDIALPSTLLKLEDHPTSMEEEYANESGPKFVNADGNEMVLTAEQREEIMSQLDQDHDGGVVMVLNESTFPQDEGTEVVANDMKLKLETSDNTDDYDDQNTEFLVGNEAAFREIDISTEINALEANKGDEDKAHEEHESEHEERMDDDDHMEWAENLISAHDVDDEEEHDDNDDKETEEEITRTEDTEKTTEETMDSSKKSINEEKLDPKKAEDINLKLKMLTGDWSDDEIDEEDENESPKLNQYKKEVEESESTIQALEDDAEKSTTGEFEDKLREEASDEFENEQEHKKEPVASSIAEDEITESSQSEKVEEEDERNKKDPQDEKLLATDDSTKTEEIVSEDIPSDTAIEENKLNVSENVTLEGRTSRRTSTTKDDESKRSNTDDDLDSKIPSPPATTKEIDDDDALAAVKDDDNLQEEKDLEAKNVEDDLAKEVISTKSAEEEGSFKTPDKVKSLINEWADDDDDDL